MARNFLGNLKGPQGPKGDTGAKGEKGDTGEFKDTAIGMINKLDVSQPELLESGDTWEFDKKTGIVNYNFVKGHFIAFDVELEPRVHTFRIEDFTDNTVYDGDFRFQVRDSNREYIHLTNVPKKGHYTFDLSSYEGVEKSYAIQAGREIRIMVKPDTVNDEELHLLARTMTKQIEDELEYPGQIKVSIIRETRAIEYAK